MKTLHIKKALSALLVMLMLTFALSIPAFAAEGANDTDAASSSATQVAEVEAEGVTTSG